MSIERVTNFRKWLDTLPAETVCDLRTAIEGMERAGLIPPSPARMTNNQFQQLLEVVRAPGFMEGETDPAA